uniref:Uncharacterized protein n=1 Tax=Plectus sambesii TaxID=2011161 RepID=A0A914V0M7_9BILA
MDLCDVDSSFTLLTQVVVYFGSACSIVSVVNNSLIFWSLATHKDRFTCYFQYLMLLSFFDVFVSFSYIPVITIDHLKDVLQSLPMARAWWQYFGVMLAVTHVAMTASYFLLLGASIERFCITTRSRFLHLVQTRRTFFCTVAIFIALFTKAPIVMELDLLPNPNCTGTVAEYFVDIDGLIDKHFEFYMSSTDLVSLLTMLGCAVRLPIYMSCNKELRRVIINRLGFRRPAADDVQSVNLQYHGVTQNLLYEHFEGIKPTMRLLRADRSGSVTDERRLMMNVL